jgi:hypothetical protein
MKHSINIPYTLNNQQADYQVPISYEITNKDNLQTLSCIVNMTSAFPAWLQMRKFEVISKLVEGRYMTLYNEHNDSKNIDCTLFIDKAYAIIMRKEKVKLHSDALV